MSNKPTYVYTKSSYVDRMKNEQYGGHTDRLTTYLSPEQAVDLIAILVSTVFPEGIAAHLKYSLENEELKDIPGVKLTAYTNDKTNRQTGEKFKSTAISVMEKVVKTGPLNQRMEREAQAKKPERPFSDDGHTTPYSERPKTNPVDQEPVKQSGSDQQRPATNPRPTARGKAVPVQKAKQEMNAGFDNEEEIPF